MREIGLVRQVSGDWIRATDKVRLRIEADGLEGPHDLLIAVRDVQPLVMLLLVLSGKAGTVGPRDPNETRLATPLPVDSLGLGQDENGDAVLELEIGRTSLAFTLPGNACKKLGQSLLALSGSQGQLAN
jgi:hypothetical protein